MIGRALVIAGIAIAVLGGVIWGMSIWFPNLRLGRLPGDLVIERDDLKLYFPITTMVLASLALSAIAWIIKWVQR